MTEQKWREVTFDDLRGMTPAEQKACRVRIGDVTRQVAEVTAIGNIYTLDGTENQVWHLGELDHWGAVFEAPVSPPRPLPTRQGAVIRLGKGDVFEFDGDRWLAVGDETAYAPERVQSRTDRHGWVELVPADGPNAEDARSAAIREVEADFRAQDLIKTAARVRDRFPEAFSGAVNTKETGDE